MRGDFLLPEPVRVDAIRAEGREVRHLEETGSTNDDARARGFAGAAHGSLILAESQTGGRGRRGAAWHSPPRRNLLFSLVLRPEASFEDWPRLTTLAAGALVEALSEFVEADLRIKWPNDVYGNGRKLAGLLAETSVDREGRSFLILGMGVNINGEEEDFPGEIRNLATSLRMLNSGEPLDRTRVLVSVLSALDRWLPRLKTDAFLAALPELTRRQLHLGLRVGCVVGGGLIQGTFLGLDELGGMRLGTADGEISVRSAEQVREVSLS